MRTREGGGNELYEGLASAASNLHLHLDCPACDNRARAARAHGGYHRVRTLEEETLV